MDREENTVGLSEPAAFLWDVSAGTPIEWRVDYGRAASHLNAPRAATTPILNDACSR
jgi:hypothetical protein